MISITLTLLFMAIANVSIAAATTTTSDIITNTVRSQYEILPYPTRNPMDEDHRLEPTPFAKPFLINRIVFKGSNTIMVPNAKHLNFTVRVLIAGGGTGDSTIHLSQRCTDLNISGVHIVHLDLSQASIRIAQARLARRNISSGVTVAFVRGSILDLMNKQVLPGCSLPFDYIDCVGVLHHLPDPVQGARALQSVLADHGAIGMMLYAPGGRRGLYEVQEMLRLLMKGKTLSVPEQLSLARIQWQELSNDHIAKINPALAHIEHSDDSAFYDFVLHSQDQPFTISEIVELLKNSEMEILDFLVPKAYEPSLHTSNEKLLQAAENMSWVEQASYAELLSGWISAHQFFAIKKGRKNIDQHKPSADRIISSTSILCPLVPFQQPDFDWVFDRDRTINMHRSVASFHLEFGGISGLAWASMTLANCVKNLRDLFEELERIASEKSEVALTWDYFLAAIRMMLKIVKNMHMVVVR